MCTQHARTVNSIHIDCALGHVLQGYSPSLFPASRISLAPSLRYRFSVDWSIPS